jgi:hypothetical protein
MERSRHVLACGIGGSNVTGVDVSTSRLAIPLILAGIGGVWLGQGLGVIGGSAMTSDPFWAGVGAVLVGLAVVLVIRGRRGGARG